MALPWADIGLDLWPVNPLANSFARTKKLLGERHLFSTVKFLRRQILECPYVFRFKPRMNTNEHE